MKRILINDRCLYRPNAGVAMYLRNVLSHWPADAAVQPAGFMSDHLGRRPQSAGPPQGATPLQLRPLAKLGRPATLGTRLPHWARRGLQKLYASAYAGAARRGYAGQFEPNHLAVPADVPTAATIHDLSVLDHGEWHPDDRVQWWRADLERAVAATDRWIAVSQFTRRRMIDALSLPPERIEVIPLAAREL
ncbi:MAG TPA: hypothetical protein DCX07_00550, partial [Phycisphaerales bacterium]|nr:hypothetical protein [Phycisphaerales bacterium]